ncbi:MAG: peptide chain release factor 2 [Oscillospiraceae bacterium]|jgi:peptide chain release factor 2|nr:peptide chain release factor 2 [Oscillospiraceae bacterium]
MLEFEEYKTRLHVMAPTLATLKDALKPDDARAEITRLEESTQQPGFWDDRQASQKTQKQIKQLRSKVALFGRLESAYEDLLTICEMALEENDESMLNELIEGFSDFERELETARLSTLLSGEYDGAGAIMTFHAGAGGTEAQDWAQMLFRMYTRWAERHGFKWKTLDYLDGEEAGLKSATISIDGENAYGFLKSENGIHRLVRISPFDASGRRHTSFAAVEVMPQITDEGDIEIRPEDLKVDTYRSSGAGGQHVNKTESAIRITHVPSGIVVSCQTERSQHQNREYAMQMLRARLAEIKEREHLERVEDIKGVQMKIEWGSQIRSYVFMPYTLAKDHRTNFESGNIGAVMDGEIDGFINAYLAAKAAG